jgi:Asp-tRNA(Asn)/Glu-tRNA(Gln) amidotransferase A subunit family amidase
MLVNNEDEKNDSIIFFQMLSRSVTETARLLASGSLTSSSLIFHACKRLDNIQPLNVFVSEFRDCAQKAARDSDARLAAKKPLGFLEGIPVAVKDNFCVAGTRTSCASQMLDNFTAPYSATVVERSLQSGGILLGKTNLGQTSRVCKIFIQRQQFFFLVFRIRIRSADSDKQYGLKR